MAGIREKINELYTFETLSLRESPIHSLNPLVKALLTFCYVVCVISTGRYDILLPAGYVLYPIIMIALADIPYSVLIKRTLIALPFVVFIGLSNVLIDKTIAFYIGGIAVSFGALSLISLMVRTLLCVSAILVLIATTPMTRLTGALRTLRIPSIFISVFEMTYRYIGVLAGEASDMRTAYALRSKNKRGVDIRHAGSFAGSLLLRSFDRSERIYSAMKCRGYGSERAGAARLGEPIRPSDITLLLLLAGAFVLVRIYDPLGLIVTALS